jgi:hypothetical protein
VSLDAEGRETAAVESEAQRTARRLKGQLDELRKHADELEAIVGLYRTASSAPLSPADWTIEPRSPGKAGLVVAQLTDTHFDEVVQAAEVLGLNAYNREIAVLRFRKWTEKVVTLPRTYTSGIDLEGLVILATGDILSGNIHAELKESNEDHLYASLLFWIEQILSALLTLEREYDGNVQVNAVVGNHGRSTVKPVYKGRAFTNIEWVLWSVVRDRLRDQGSKVAVHVSDSMDLNVPIYGRNHLITHGDQFKGGTGISGVLAPLMLGTHRKGQRQAVAGAPMSLMVMGHFHQLLDLPGVIVGGSMKGYDEYAFGLNLRPEQAAQMLWITTPEYGKTVTLPVFLQDREAEGW